MQRSNSWLAALCRFVGLYDNEPVLPIYSPSRSEGCRSPVGFAAEPREAWQRPPAAATEPREAATEPPALWARKMEAGQCSPSVFIPIAVRHRNRQNIQFAT